jgi:hypothetical protein
MSNRVKHLVVCAAALCAALLPSTAHAQAGGAATITGQVLDATTNAPVAEAVVAIVELRRAVKTDSVGSFVLAGLAPGSYHWSVLRLGYVPLEQQMDLADGDHFRVGVMQRPAPVEPFTVALSRASEHFRRRVNSALTPVRLLMREVLLEGHAATAEPVVAERAELRPCPVTVADAATKDCVMARGRLQPVALFIDEVAAPGGVFQLSAFEPDELYAVELWNGGAEIRVFTNRFVEGLANGKVQFAPRGE